MTEQDLGAYFVGPDETLWKLVGYAASPTASLEQVYPPPNPTDAILGRRPRRVGGVVGSPIFDGFVRLVQDVPLAEVARCAYPGCRAEEVELVGRVRVGREDELAFENVFACPSHERWLRDDAGENLHSVGASS